jgi:hypothetical protein
MHFRVRRTGRPGFGIYFPIILVWILVFAILLVLLPFLLLAALITSWKGPGFALLLVYPALFSVLWHLGGLRIETGHAGNEVLIDF